jgi:hypothetical protein
LGLIKNILGTKKKNHEGEIYYVSPKHIVKKKEFNSYKQSKGGNASNKRPVVVGVQRKGTKVQISKLTTKASKKQIDKKQKVELKKTFSSSNGYYIDTNTIAKSRLTNKPFEIGKTPLNKTKRDIHQEDLKAYKEARKARGR